MVQDLFAMRLTAAVARLPRIIRLHGIPAQQVDDLIQETSLIAWKNQRQLRDPERIDAWIDGICRHLCRHHATVSRYRPQVSSFSINEASIQPALPDPPDPEMSDLANLFDQADWEHLLDQAFTYLPAATRHLVELCYLSGLPQREVALRLGLTLSALEARLHRARLQLRQIVLQKLRPEAEALGLLVGLPSEGGHPTRIWCFFCGRYRLEGAFVRLPDGSVALQMRCANGQCPVIDTQGWVVLDDLTSMKSALHRMLKKSYTYWDEALTRNPTMRCGQFGQVRLIAAGDSSQQTTECAST